jgi:predicted house-cleaning NTP pyrophosphatase (Maf/HAM1 superfamily)
VRQVLLGSISPARQRLLRQRLVERVDAPFPASRALGAQAG